MCLYCSRVPKDIIISWFLCLYLCKKKGIRTKKGCSVFFFKSINFEILIMLNPIYILLMILLCVRYQASASFFHNHRFNLQVSVKQQNVINNESKSNSSTLYPILGDKYGPFFMKMPINHFNKNNTKFFDNRFWVNTDHYKSKGPLICK